jgi:hypothetical protein
MGRTGLRKVTPTELRMPRHARSHRVAIFNLIKGSQVPEIHQGAAI